MKVRRGIVRGALASACVVTLLAACNSSDTTDAADDKATTTAAATSIPVDETFYETPDSIPEGKPGTLVDSAPANAPEGVTATNLLYTSTSLEGDDIVVSGVLYVPEGAAPDGGRPLVTWAHGTAGTADSCAPSKGAANEGIPGFDGLMEKGYAVVATDYEGLGTEGLHPFLVGESEGRGVLDAARAAAQVTEAEIGDEVAIYGYSQGGHAALFAGQIAPTYAPELNIVGDAAGAPVGDMKLLVPVSVEIPDFRGFAIMVGFAYQAAYPDVDPSVFVTPEAFELGQTVLEEECVGGVLDAFEDPDMEVFVASPLDVAPWPDLLTENTPGAEPIGFPVFTVQGLDDTLVPSAVTDTWLERACANGTQVELKTYAGEDHEGAATASADDVVAWIADRFDGVAVTTDSCPIRE